MEENFERCFLTDTLLHIRVSWEKGDYEGTKEFSFLPECTIVQDAKTAEDASLAVEKACREMDELAREKLPVT